MAVGTGESCTVETLIMHIDRLIVFKIACSKILIGIKDTYLFYYSILEFPYSDSVVNTSLADLFEFRSQYYSLVVSCSGFSKLECFFRTYF